MILPSDKKKVERGWPLKHQGSVCGNTAEQFSAWTQE